MGVMGFFRCRVDGGMGIFWVWGGWGGGGVVGRGLGAGGRHTLTVTDETRGVSSSLL